MQIGIFAKTFPGSDPDSVLRQSAGAGFEGVQYNMACSGLAAMPDEIGPGIPQAVAAAAAKYAQPVFAVSGTYNMIHPNPAVRAAGERRLAVIAAACHGLNTSLVTLCTGTRDTEDQWRHHPRNSDPDAWRDLLRAVEAALAIAEAHGVMLGIEPEPANVVSSAKVACRLLEEMRSDRIGIVLDPANLAEDASPEQHRTLVAEAIDTLGDRIVMAHAKDRNPGGEVVAPGRGVVDFGDFLWRLNAAGFRGPIVAHGFPASEAATVASFLTQKRATLAR